jgi:Xaa-Pro aminopeptidase
MPEEHQSRRNRLRATLADLDVEAALITNLVNVRYLTGFTGSNAVLLVTHDSAALATDGRYTEQSAREVPDLERVIDRRCAEVLLERAAAGGARAVAFEAHDVNVERFADLERAAGPARLTPLGHAVETLRQVKDDGEIALLREACAIGDRALADLLPTLHPGQTERQIARRLENLMLDHGAHGLSFESIVAGGPNSAVPHHQPTDRPLQAGEFVKLDFGAQYSGYHADMTRTIVVGKHVEAWQEDLYVLVRAAQRAGRQALAPGVPVSEVDRAARSVIDAAGFGEAFSHGLGHGVGLEIHEAPMIGASLPGTLEAGMPVTVEPGVYLTGRGGVRIEDTLVVRDGAPELLTTTTKELLAVG